MLYFIATNVSSVGMRDIRFHKKTRCLMIRKGAHEKLILLDLVGNEVVITKLFLFIIDMP